MSHNMTRRGFLAGLLVVPAAIKVWSAPPVLEKFQWMEHLPGWFGAIDPLNHNGVMGWKATVTHRGRTWIYGDWVEVRPAKWQLRNRDDLRDAARISLRELGIPFRERDIA